MGWIIVTDRAMLSREVKEHEHRNQATRIKTQAANGYRTAHVVLRCLWHFDQHPSREPPGVPKYLA